MAVRRFVADHRRAAWAAALVVIAGAVFVVVWFQPQKLFLENTVDEAPPSIRSATDGSTSPSEEPSAPTGPSELANGAFQGLDHPTSGTAQLLELADGKRYLRLEDLDTSNGPDLRVYLSEIPASDDSHGYGERFIDLGSLKGNRGDQNYLIPAGTDLSRYKSAVIWCRRFTVGFGVAGLS